jgi:hypothetical protein
VWKWVCTLCNPLLHCIHYLVFTRPSAADWVAIMIGQGDYSISLYIVQFSMFTSVACALGPKCYHVLNWFFLPKPGFLIFGEFIWIFFQWQKSLKNQYPPPPTFWIQILPNKFPLNPAQQDLFNNNTKGTFQFLQNFQLQFNWIFSEEIIQYSRTFCTTSPNIHGTKQAHATLVVKSFPKTPWTRSEASQFGGSHNYKTRNKIKQNKTIQYKTKQNKTNYLLPS